MVITLLLLACGAGDPTDTQSGSESTAFDAAEMLTRASLDIRGVRPNLEDVTRIHQTPDDLDTLIEGYLHDPRFPRRVMDLYSEIYLTQGEAYSVPFSAFEFDEGITRANYTEAIGDEPLRILAHIAASDLPYTDLVTADWTMHNHVLGQMYPTDYPDDQAGWQRAHYTDGRPTAGVLSTNGMWWRFLSTPSNQNRKRANQISRIFLCNDYLTKPINFDRDVNLLDEEAVANAIKYDPGCVSCHVSLDPLASYLYGFWYVDETSAGDATVYHPEREQKYVPLGGPNPGYFGQPGTSIADLGHKIASDPRFIECAVETAFTRLMGRDATLGDTDALTLHREAFLDGDLTLRSLFSSIVGHPRYRSAASAPDGFAERKLVTANLLASQVMGITGYLWTQGGVEMMKSDAIGVGNLAGRADGQRMIRNNRSPNATMLLVNARLAEAATAHLLKTEAGWAKDDRNVFTDVDFSETIATNRPAIVEQILRLHAVIFGRQIEADGEEVAANIALFEELMDATSDPYVAWGGVMIALLRDPDFLMY
jgi:hypothetical protein